MNFLLLTKLNAHITIAMSALYCLLLLLAISQLELQMVLAIKLKSNLRESVKKKKFIIVVLIVQVLKWLLKLKTLLSLRR